MPRKYWRVGVFISYLLVELPPKIYNLGHVLRMEIIHTRAERQVREAVQRRQGTLQSSYGQVQRLEEEGGEGKAKERDQGQEV